VALLLLLRLEVIQQFLLMPLTQLTQSVFGCKHGLLLITLFFLALQGFAASISDCESFHALVISQLS
jgi:hypothetical protein